MTAAALFRPRVAQRRGEHRMRERHAGRTTPSVGQPEPIDEADLALVCPAADIELEDVP